MSNKITYTMIALTLAGAMGIGGCKSKQIKVVQPVKPIEITIKELTTNPGQYDNKMISVNGQIMSAGSHEWSSCKYQSLILNDDNDTVNVFLSICDSIPKIIIIDSKIKLAHEKGYKIKILGQYMKDEDTKQKIVKTKSVTFGNETYDVTF